jgi:hypothetical protein
MSKPKLQKSDMPAAAAQIKGQCSMCRWAIREGNGVLRCHSNPPQIRTPYDNLSAWPVVPEQGGGCRLWEEKP